MLCCNNSKRSKQAIKASLTLTVIADVVLCVALMGSLFYYFYNGKSFSPHYIVGFSAFFILFTGFFVSLMVAIHTKEIRAILVTVVFTVARFICAIVVVIAWMSEYHGWKESKKTIENESEDPYEWIAHRKAILMTFAGIYIKIFITQLFILNRYYAIAADTRREEKEREINLLISEISNLQEKLYRLENTLSEMKEVLEEDYSDLWHESEFCFAFLALQDEHQRLVRLAKSNSDGENPRRFHWANRYANIHIK